MLALAGRQQRDRRHSAGRGSGGDGPCGRRASRLRRGSGGRQDPLRPLAAGRRCRLSCRRINSAARKASGRFVLAPDSHHIRDALLRGGGQERGLRAGTENIAGIAGMAAALARREGPAGGASRGLSLWRDELEAEIARIAPGAVFFGAGAERLPNTSCFAVPSHRGTGLAYVFGYGGYCGIVRLGLLVGEGEAVACLDRDGGGTDLARGAIRVSLGWTSRPEDCVSLRAGSRKDGADNQGEAGIVRRMNERLSWPEIMPVLLSGH